MTFSSDEELTLRISEHQAKAGRIGGQSRSPEKRKAVSANLAKARAKRWPGREIAHGIQEEERISSLRGREEPPRGECGTSLPEPDSKPSKPEDGESNRERDKGTCGTMSGFLFDGNLPKRGGTN